MKKVFKSNLEFPRKGFVPPPAAPPCVKNVQHFFSLLWMIKLISPNFFFIFNRAGRKMVSEPNFH